MLAGIGMNNPTGASGGWDGDTGWEEVGMEANGKAAVMGKAHISHTVTDRRGPQGHVGLFNAPGTQFWKSGGFQR